MKIAYYDHEEYNIRHQNNLKTLAIVDQWKNDSLKRALYRKIAVRFWNINDYESYKKVIEKNIKFSINASDNYLLSKSYVDLGDYYLSRKTDSAYHCYNLAEKISYKSRDTINIISCSLTKRPLRINAHDYIGAEKIIFDVIPIIRSQRRIDIESLYYCYSILTNIYNNLKNYKQSLFYCKQALNQISKIKRKLLCHPKSLVFSGIAINYADTGGKMKIQSTQNDGTTIKLTIPLIQNEAL